MPEIPPSLPSSAPTAEIAATAASPAERGAVIELCVRNHAGAMSHIAGLFARRAFNLEAIACAPDVETATSRMLLLVAETPRLEQVERQLEKLHDVLSLRHRPDVAPSRLRGMLAGFPG